MSGGSESRRIEAMAYNLAATLDLVDGLPAGIGLRNYHLRPSGHGELLDCRQRPNEACTPFEPAAALANNARRRALLLARAATR